MRNSLVLEKEGSSALAADSLLKATSLLYLKDALEEERYEECGYIIENAKSYGASRSEISAVVAKHIRKLNSGQNGAASKRPRLFS